MRRNASVVCETCKTNWQKESQSMKEDLETPSDDPLIPFGAEICLDPISTKDKKSSPSIWDKDASRKIHRMHSQFCNKLGPRLYHRGQARRRELRRVRGSRNKIQVQEVGNQEKSRFSEARRSRTTSNFTPPGSREIPRGRSTLHFGRSEE